MKITLAFPMMENGLDADGKEVTPTLPAGTPGVLKWGKWLTNWPFVPSGTHAAVELEDGHVQYVPICLLAG